MRHPPISPKIRAVVLARREAGEDFNDIARDLDITPRSARGIWDRHTYHSRSVSPAPATAVPIIVEREARAHVVIGLHGVSLPRLRCLEAM